MRTRKPHPHRRTVRRVYPGAGIHAPAVTPPVAPRPPAPARRGPRFAARFLGNLAGRFVYEWLKDVLGGFLSL